MPINLPVVDRAVARSPVKLGTSGLSSRSQHSSSCATYTTLAFDAPADSTTSTSTSTSTPTPSPSPTDSLVATKTRDLLSSLERRDSDPSQPWRHYVDLLNYLGLERLPLDVHQLVLRKCVPPASVIRVASAREQRALHYPHAPHAYENRLQTVMKSIRSAGWRAELDDYHFLLEQFAAVGHHVGSRGVLQEMALAGIQPRTRTYGLCLQALARRLTLPCPEERREALIEETTKMTRELMRDMRTKAIPFTSVNMDLAVRILRETLDEKGFDELIKFSYGIDLAYPDRLPLEVIERQSTSKTEASEALDPPSFPLQPLSTPALNVIVDTLGRTGRISKMVQTFEVLTQPLPKSSQSSASFFDEDEDDYSSFNPPSIPEPIFPLPFAKPNATTLRFLIKHASQADHAVFARHYLVYAWSLDRAEDRRLKRDVRTLPVDEIIAPLLAVNKDMLLPVFGLSNREKRVDLMRWTLRMIKRALSRKRRDLIWYTYKRATRFGRGMATNDQSESVTSAIDGSSGEADVDLSSTGSSSGDGDGASGSTSPAPSCSEALAVPTAESPRAGSASISASSPEPPPAPPTSSSTEPSHDRPGPSVVDPDLDSDRPPSAPASRIFDIDGHVSILQRDIQQIEQLESEVETVLGRTIHRIKERLGRRVWSTKDVWLANEDARVPLSKVRWREAVNFVAPSAMKPFRWRSPRRRDTRRQP
ncbi:hypothetical protein F5148DRAFT_1274751 [Russula earlei]|uniref:Uncharacterized protein n=1 Tax=Russula earlei TaxID=71964 RepID=A0ACC0UFS2_9AGAM|nr:hypothetical protein F5148DRAFT_1274751 [Russula earlei]